MEIILLLPAAISFILCALLLPKWIRKCWQNDMLWENMNKYDHPRNVAASGGIIIVMSFVLSVLSYIAIKTFILHENGGIDVYIFSLLSVILILAITGLTDDLLGWKHGGLSKRFRIFLAIAASIPLVVINAGEQAVNIPFLGYIDFGIIYPLIIIPIGIAGATTTYNFLAGMNGLEAGQGIIILSAMALVSYLTGTAWLALAAICMIASLAVFYYYNRFPAKVLPGDIMTYSIGGLIASMAILGNIERIAVFFFIPYILEVFLKLRGNLKKQSFGKPNKDGSLELPYDKIYGITHLSILILKKFKKKVFEKDVVYLIHAFQIGIILIGLIIFRKSIF